MQRIAIESLTVRTQTRKVMMAKRPCHREAAVMEMASSPREQRRLRNGLESPLTVRTAATVQRSKTRILKANTQKMVENTISRRQSF